MEEEANLPIEEVVRRMKERAEAGGGDDEEEEEEEFDDDDEDDEEDSDEDGEDGEEEDDDDEEEEEESTVDQKVSGHCMLLFAPIARTAGLTNPQSSATLFSYVDAACCPFTLVTYAAGLAKPLSNTPILQALKKQKR